VVVGREEGTVGLEKLGLEFDPVQTKRVQEALQRVHTQQHRKCHRQPHGEPEEDRDGVAACLRALLLH